MPRILPPETHQAAWIGDAVLSLYVRQWILAQTGKTDGAQLTEFTSNQFLALFGNPTEVEAAIGRRYEAEGLAAAFAWIEAELLPTHLARLRRRARQRK